MKYEMIKTAAESITMPEETKQRIAENCRKNISTKTEEQTMNTKTNGKRAFIRKPAVVFAAIALCVCFCATAALAGTGIRQGFFRDITDNRGAIVGTAYEAAADEILLEAAVDGENLTVMVDFADPAKAPYVFSELLSIAEYRIVDTDGSTVAAGRSDEAAAVSEGHAEITVYAGELESGSYRLIVTTFTSEKKADQPLNIFGVWECGFTK